LHVNDMTKPSAAKSLPLPNSDFYNYHDMLNAEERAILQRVRAFLESKGQPIINKYLLADYNVARFFADAEAIYSYEGAYQMQNLIVGKAITGFSAFV